MTVPPESAGTLSRGEKQALLRKILLKKIGRTRSAPASFAQERLWFIDRLEPGSAVYNMPIAWRLEGALDAVALERALGEIVRRHEALRTTFSEADGSPVQVIAPFGGFSLPVEDLSEVDEADREAALARRAGEEARRPFDLAAGPLVEDDFFELGGRSLLGTGVIGRLRLQFGVELKMDAIFRAPTVAALAREIEDAALAAVEAMSEEEALALR